MNYKLFDEFITLQALFKELGIIQSGGAIKAFLLENQVEVNGEVETRRGRKLRVGDSIEVIGDKEIITIAQPSPEEMEDYQADKLEKERVAQLVKKLNKEQIEKSFELFYSEGSTKNSNGLGLYIIKNILTNYNIDYSFEKSKIGMVFRFRIPIKESK